MEQDPQEIIVDGNQHVQNQEQQNADGKHDEQESRSAARVQAGEGLRVLRIQFHADLREDGNGPGFFLQPACIIGILVKGPGGINDRLLEDEGEIEDDAGEIGDQEI